MKNFKKSLLVVPALGVLMLAAAGSVGGTVAWFSSVSTFNTNISSFAVGRVAGNLDVTMTADKGTLKVGNAIVVGADAAGDVKLTHGSFNHTASPYSTGVYYVTAETVTATTDVSEGSVTVDKATFLSKENKIGDHEFTYVSSNWKYNDVNVELANYGITLTGTPAANDTITVTVASTFEAADSTWKVFPGKRPTTEGDRYWYYAVSWNMSFTYTFGSDTTSRNLYLNASTSAITPTPAAASGLESFKGFRIAFVNASHTLVWAPEQNVAAECNYVSSASATSTYTSGVLLNKGDASVTAESGPGANNTHNYMGTFAKGLGDSTTLTFTCVAWYDGTDINVQNAATLHSVAATLNFFAIDAAA